MSTISELIINNLENMELFDDRYSDLKCINYDEDPNNRHGYFSLIFTALDIVNDNKVIIKIYDPKWMTDAYRLKCFEREALLLEKVLNKKRCLQLKKAISCFNLNLELQDGNTLPYELKYFVTDHLPISIFEKFYENSNNGLSTKEKLLLFRQIIFSIKVLHDYEISHRDLKPDNLRGYLEGLKTIVVAIDFGTAVHTKMDNIKNSYLSGCVGHKGYSSPESYSGLAGIRELDFYTDFYSLGCMLYELFCYDQLFYQFKKINTDYYKILDYCRQILSSSNDKINKWYELSDRFKGSIKYPKFNHVPSDLPPVLHPYLNDLLERLLYFDYRERENNYKEIIRRIDLCITIIENELYQKYVIEKKKLFKLNRQKRIEIVKQKHTLRIGDR